MKKLILVLSCYSLITIGVVEKYESFIKAQRVQQDRDELEDKQTEKEDALLEEKTNNLFKKVNRQLGIKDPEPCKINNNQSSSSNIHSLSSNFLVQAIKNNASYCCITGVVAVIFCIFRSRILEYRNYLSQTTLWSSWRNDLSFISLVSVPKETLTQWIVEDIQDHYHDDHSIKLFYNDVQAEQAQLQEIMHLYEKLDFFYMVDSQALVDVKTRLKVLGLLKDLVLMWELENALAAQQT